MVDFFVAIPSPVLVFNPNAISNGSLVTTQDAVFNKSFSDTFFGDGVRRLDRIIVKNPETLWYVLYRIKYCTGLLIRNTVNIYCCSAFQLKNVNS